MKSSNPVRLAVIGAGLVGARHVRQAHAHRDFALTWIVDPDPSRKSLADEHGCAYATRLEDVPAGDCDAAVLATPNAHHLPGGLACLQKGWATLVEKPVADTVENGKTLVDAFDARSVPLLVGHHRRYHPFVDAAKELLGAQTLGAPVMASLIWAVRKPDSYFDAGAWRKGNDGGPLLINFIHEADLMLALFGPVAEVKAIRSNHQRGAAVEDSAAILIRFQNGVIATLALSDAALTPWSFEGASGENPTIAETGISSWRIGCTKGSFEFPGLRIWTDAQGGDGDWSRRLQETLLKAPRVDPLKEQLTHFAQLASGRTHTPRVSGHDGLEALRLVEAVFAAD